MVILITKFRQDYSAKINLAGFESSKHFIHMRKKNRAGSEIQFDLKFKKKLIEKENELKSQ